MSQALLTDLGTGKAYLLNGEASLGRDGGNDIVLQDDAVSGRHARISSTGNAWYISDTGSGDGIEMNGFRVPAEGKLGLRNGCRLRLGNTTLQFTTDAEAIQRFTTSQNRAGTQSNRQPGPVVPNRQPGPVVPNRQPGPAMPNRQPGPVVPNRQPGPAMPNRQPGPAVPNRQPGPAVPNRQPGPVVPNRQPGPAVPNRQPGPAVPNRQPGPAVPNRQPGPGTPDPQPGPGAAGADPGRRGKNKKAVVALISAAALIALVLGWCLVNHSKGSREMEEGDYIAAISTFQKDFLFSGSQRLEAARLAGEDAFSRENYIDAMYLFTSAGEAGKARWSDAVYEQALLYLADDEADQAIELLNQISDETRAQEQLGAAMLAKARQQYAEGDVDAAIQTAREIRDTTYADVTAFLDTVYHEQGNELFAAGSYREAIESFLQCEKDPVAKTNADILQKLYTGDYYQTAVQADKLILGGKTDLSREQWAAAFESLIGEPDWSDINQVLSAEAAKKRITGSPAFESDTMRSSFDSEAPHGSMIGIFQESSEYFCVVGDLDALYTRCGTEPNGKVLIIAQRLSYSDEKPSWAVLLDLMRLLPDDAFPFSLDEVEYIVLVSYNFRNDGFYTSGKTVALQEYADLTVLQLPDMQKIHASERIYGASAPDSFYYTGSPPAWKSGNAPHMGEEIYDAITSILPQ